MHDWHLQCIFGRNNKQFKLKTFITDNFLLNSKTSEKLYHDFAKKLPIIDYHNHLNPKEIAENVQFDNATQVWLSGDHYKWRAMRTLGVEEKYITGEATDEEKFIKWAEILKYTIRNPLYHWTHLELMRYFKVDEILSKSNAKSIYNELSNKLNQESHRTIGLLEQQNVEVVCTTEDPLDNLQYHKTFKAKEVGMKLSTAFRPDEAYALKDYEGFLSYIEKLEIATKIVINSYDDYIEALEKRITFFHENGCRLCDHGLPYLPFFETGTYKIEKLFTNVKNGKQLSQSEIDYFKCETLKHLCKLYHKMGWVQQFHLGPLRNVNSRLVNLIGKNSGFDSIGDFSQALNLGKFLNHLDKDDQLTKTIIYNLNPSDNEVFAAMIGNFNDGTIKGKVQFGAAWWFLDQKDGIEKQLNALSNIGLISCFVGMLTDSRSFLSFPRHEYFRRVLCNMIGNDVEKGELPNDIPFLGEIIQDICYYNAKNYFDFD